MGNQKIHEHICCLEGLVLHFDENPFNYMDQSNRLRILFTGSSGKPGLLEELSGFQMPLLKRSVDVVERKGLGFLLPGPVTTKNERGGSMVYDNKDWVNSRLRIVDGGIELCTNPFPLKNEYDESVNICVSRIGDMFDEKFLDLDEWLNQKFLRPECTISTLIKHVANKDGGAHEDKHTILLRSLQQFNRLQNCIINSISKETCKQCKFFLTENDFGPIAQK